MAEKAYMTTVREKYTSGSALLIALIIMGILLTLTLGVSQLLLGTYKENRLLLEKTKAWYAAESGVEQALFEIAENPPGYETTEANVNIGTGTKYGYSIEATGNAYPRQNQPGMMNTSENFANLRLNEAVVIPLFRINNENTENKAEDFRVDYFFQPDFSGNMGKFLYEDLDILRWKIFGIKQNGDVQEMEVISEYVPMKEGNRTSNNPSCVGTNNNCWNAAKYYQKDQYGYYNLIPQYPIETFLNEHNKNFLVLSNILNIDLIGGSLSDRDKMRIATIRYRVINNDNDENLTLPYIKIQSDGESGGAKQSIDLSVKRESFLPVFNYALYRTKED